MNSGHKVQGLTSISFKNVTVCKRQTELKTEKIQMTCTELPPLRGSYLSHEDFFGH